MFVKLIHLSIHLFIHLLNQIPTDTHALKYCHLPNLDGQKQKQFLVIKLCQAESSVVLQSIALFLVLFWEQGLQGWQKNREIIHFVESKQNSLPKIVCSVGSYIYIFLSEYLFTKDAEFRLKNDNKREKQATAPTCAVYSPTCAVGECTKQNSGVGHGQQWPELQILHSGIYDQRTPKLGYMLMLDSLS